MDLLNKLLEKKKVAQDKDIKDREGTQPSKYYAKDAEGDDMAKSTKQARARHFEKGTKKDDDDPSAYEPAPGDKSAETKPSQHTKKFKKVFGENYDGDMALNALENIIRNANNLKGVVKEDGDYPAWWNSKLTKADDYLDVCHDYLMSELSQSEQIEEGKLVAPANQIIKQVAKEIEKKMENLYRKRESDGVKLINQLARMVGMTVSDKMQKKGTLFLKMGDALQEDATVDAAQLKAKHAEEMERLKANHEQELEALKDRHDRESKRVEQQKEKETQDKQIQSKRDADRKSAEKKRESQSEETIGEKRLADILRDKEKSNQKAHQQRIIKLARQSIKKNKKEEVEEDRDYKKEYANYHSQPEQIKRRAKRNEARRLMKDNKDIKGKDVHHKDNNPMNNDKKNLSVVTQNYNRKEPRLRNEVLDKNASQQDYIDDFLDSDAPQFKGKSKDKIIKMAVAAYNERNK